MELKRVCEIKGDGERASVYERDRERERSGSQAEKYYILCMPSECDIGLKYLRLEFRSGTL